MIHWLSAQQLQHTANKPKATKAAKATKATKAQKDQKSQEARLEKKKRTKSIQKSQKGTRPGGPGLWFFMSRFSDTDRSTAQSDGGEEEPSARKSRDPHLSGV